MAELLDPDGVWDQDLIALMLPVAIELEADQAEATFGAVAAAASSLFSKEGPEAFRQGLDRVRGEVRRAQVEARGGAAASMDSPRPRPRTVPGHGVAAAETDPTGEAMMGLFRKLGLRQAGVRRKAK